MVSKLSTIIFYGLLWYCQSVQTFQYSSENTQPQSSPSVDYHNNAVINAKHSLNDQHNLYRTKRKPTLALLLAINGKDKHKSNQIHTVHIEDSSESQEEYSSEYNNKYSYENVNNKNNNNNNGKAILNKLLEIGELKKIDKQPSKSKNGEVTHKNNNYDELINTLHEVLNSVRKDNLKNSLSINTDDSDASSTTSDEEHNGTSYEEGNSKSYDENYSNYNSEEDESKYYDDDDDDNDADDDDDDDDNYYDDEYENVKSESRKNSKTKCKGNYNKYDPESKEYDDVNNDNDLEDYSNNNNNNNNNDNEDSYYEDDADEVHDDDDDDDDHCNIEDHGDDHCYDNNEKQSTTKYKQLFKLPKKKISYKIPKKLLNEKHSQTLWKSKLYWIEKRLRELLGIDCKCTKPKMYNPISDHKFQKHNKFNSNNYNGLSSRFNVFPFDNEEEENIYDNKIIDKKSPQFVVQIVDDDSTKNALLSSSAVANNIAAEIPKETDLFLQGLQSEVQQKDEEIQKLLAAAVVPNGVAADDVKVIEKLQPAVSNPMDIAESNNKAPAPVNIEVENKIIEKVEEDKKPVKNNNNKTDKIKSIKKTPKKNVKATKKSKKIVKVKPQVVDVKKIDKKTNDESKNLEEKLETLNTPAPPAAASVDDIIKSIFTEIPAAEVTNKKSYRKFKEPITDSDEKGYNKFRYKSKPPSPSKGTEYEIDNENSNEREIDRKKISIEWNDHQEEQLNNEQEKPPSRNKYRKYKIPESKLPLKRAHNFQKYKNQKLENIYPLIKSDKDQLPNYRSARRRYSAEKHNDNDENITYLTKENNYLLPPADNIADTMSNKKFSNADDNVHQQQSKEDRRHESSSTSTEDTFSKFYEYLIATMNKNQNEKNFRNKGKSIPITAINNDDEFNGEDKERKGRAAAAGTTNTVEGQSPIHSSVADNNNYKPIFTRDVGGLPISGSISNSDPTENDNNADKISVHLKEPNENQFENIDSKEAKRFMELYNRYQTNLYEVFEHMPSSSSMDDDIHNSNNHELSTTSSTLTSNKLLADNLRLDVNNNNNNNENSETIIDNNNNDDVAASYILNRKNNYGINIEDLLENIKEAIVADKKDHHHHHQNHDHSNQQHHNKLNSNTDTSNQHKNNNIFQLNDTNSNEYKNKEYIQEKNIMISKNGIRIPLRLKMDKKGKIHLVLDKKYVCKHCGSDNNNNDDDDDDAAPT